MSLDCDWSLMVRRLPEAVALEVVAVVEVATLVDAPVVEVAFPLPLDEAVTPEALEEFCAVFVAADDELVDAVVVAD